MRLSAADCICISGFWGLRPQTPTGALPLDPAGGRGDLGDPLCPPYLQTLATPLENASEGNNFNDFTVFRRNFILGGGFSNFWG